MSSSRVTASRTIAAPADRIFAILADPRQHPLIDGSGSVRASISGPDRLRLDSRFGMDMRLGAPYKIRNRVVEFEEGRLIAWRHVGLHRWRYELAPQEEGSTLVTETWDLSAYPPPGRWVLNALYRARTQRAVEATLVKLEAAATGR
ncbi:SRPBCC family protein [Nocardioides sp. KIGAM211]|uniref:SRPBCC family protein n=1 Tax=Nocardioides luti TaxID=2761101 RepID=A0A7X0VCE2_9ACTN|nr:SRPBCC family protein [Nocardioides luti]MBB6628138.1 SRPBCC family protein [Nocardioides luti]